VVGALLRTRRHAAVTATAGSNRTCGLWASNHACNGKDKPLEACQKGMRAKGRHCVVPATQQSRRMRRVDEAREPLPEAPPLWRPQHCVANEDASVLLTTKPGGSVATTTTAAATTTVDPAADNVSQHGCGSGLVDREVHQRVHAQEHG
jgi:hypothetical protein